VNLIEFIFVITVILLALLVGIQLGEHRLKRRIIDNVYGKEQTAGTVFKQEEETKENTIGFKN